MKIWNQDEGVLDTRVTATHEARSGQPAGTMANKMPFGEGASLNKPPLFCGQNYPIWCIRMKFFIQSLDKDIWNVISNNTYMNMLEINFASSKEHLDCITKNIIVSALDSDELLKIS